ncbi:MAG TPA: DEAD/DEAH box helicase [Microvirga sp.]|nr:DEAD/DEAH box helicase [Microvirga sp.]
MRQDVLGARGDGSPAPRREATTSGTAGAVAVSLVELLRETGPDRVVHVAAGGRRASDLVQAVRGFAPSLDVVAFPAWDCLPYDRAAPSRPVMGQRMAALHRLSGELTRPQLVVTTPMALLQRIPPRPAWENAVLGFREGSPLSPADVGTALRGLGYVLDERVDEVGEAALLGRVLDLYPAGSAAPVRIEHADGRVTAIHRYDPVTQLTTDRLEEVAVLPVSEWIDRGDAAAERRPGLEHWLPDLYGELDTVFALLPGATVSLDPGAEERLEAALAQIAESYESRVRLRPERGADRRPVAPDRLYLSGEAWAERLATHPVIAFRQEASGRPLPAFARQPRAVQAYVAFVEREIAAGHRVVLTAAAREDARALRGPVERALEQPIAAAAEWRDVLAAPPGSLLALQVGLDCGFRDADTRTTVIAAADVLGSRARSVDAEASRPQELAGTEIEFRLGDAVIHQEHGVGLLRGLESVETEGTRADLLRLEYADEATLMVPVEEMDRIWRYGSAADSLSLDRLDGEAWAKRRAKVDREIAATAGRLAAAMRERAAAAAPRLVPPRAAYERFAARFPYPETPDQLAAIEDTLSDLASGRPMNRLVCGDVGFGKTEVALRAAAAAALAGQQVAVVAPTTVLVRQHVQTFERRFAGLGIEVAHLSRLVSPREARAVKAGLADGSVRIVVGTHALVGKGIRFKDLALVIIDEEQRFGAAHKAKLRALGRPMHVLTLTATPIPRTLQSALAGLQDVSIIATPPARRQPIRTFLLPFDEVTVREALLREHRRDGQSFVVCPRVEDIEPLAGRLRGLAPELDMVVAHGRMPAHEIDDAMVRFADGAGDVLLATNIIESGLDVPRANTMLVWRADRFGLAQLHQLRGRVGRGRVRGVAYLLTEPGRKLARATRKRLETLESLDRLGAGFAISARDLDQRGAGDLFGEEQAGHVKLIGIGLYQHLLGQAAAIARGEAISEDWRPELNIGSKGLIPADYVPDPEVRINIYARVAKLASEEEVDALRDEMENRFGPLPGPADRLLALAGLAERARAFGVSRIDAGPQAVALTFRTDRDRAAANRAVERSQGALAWRNERLVWTWSSEGEEERIRNVAKVFRFLRQVG